MVNIIEKECLKFIHIFIKSFHLNIFRQKKVNGENLNVL